VTSNALLPPPSRPATETTIPGTNWMIGIVEEAGGTVDYIDMDEPFSRRRDGLRRRRLQLQPVQRSKPPTPPERTRHTPQATAPVGARPHLLPVRTRTGNLLPE
jgi:hypothetical protein